MVSLSNQTVQTQPCGLAANRKVTAIRTSIDTIYSHSRSADENETGEPARHKLIMRQRITFVHEPQDAINPKGLDITSTGLSLSGLKAAREDRITLGLAELPRELRTVLGQAQELHIRYVRPAPYKTIPPFNSRLSPGLHVYYSAKRSGRKESKEKKPYVPGATFIQYVCELC